MTLGKAKMLRAVTDRPLRALLYLRQSKKREESISLELQETVGRDYCARKGYAVTHVIADQITGLKWEKRAGIQETMRLVTAGEVDVVILYRWSRISRRKLHQAIAIDAIEQAGAEVESSTEPFDTRTAGGRFGRDVMLAAAVLESEQKSEQWAEAHDRRIRNGLPPRGGPRFGYVATAAGYELDGETAEVLAEMFDRYIAGAGFTAIAAWLNGRGIRTGAFNAEGERVSGGRPWDRTRVTDVLDSGFAAGRILSDGELHDGGQPRAISEDTWQAYLAARATRRGRPPRTVEPVYVLSGLIRCGDEGCGSPMHAQALGVRPGYGYMCARWNRTKQGRCVTVTRAKAEAAVLEWLAGFAADVDEAARREAGRSAARVVAKHDAEQLARAVAALDKRLVKLVLDHNAGLVPDIAFIAARDELEAERAATEEQRLDAEARQRAVAAPGAPIARALLADWDDLPVRARRDGLARLIEGVVVHRGEARNDVRVEVVPR